jgi:uncharacterized membrane protein
MGLGTRLSRILRHRWLDETDGARAIGTEGLKRLEQRIAASERRHSGEIRVCVEAGLPMSYLWRDAVPRERAVMLFGKLRVWDTEHNSGVLIYLLLVERTIEIVADRGITRRVPQATWDNLLAGMQAAFRGGRFEAGLSEAIDAVDALLTEHFPVLPGEANPNELPDRVDLR